MASNGEGISNNDARCNERKEEGHRRKDKDIIINDGSEKKPKWIDFAYPMLVI